MPLTNELTSFFTERYSEVETYLDFLKDIEVATRAGPPRLRNSNAVISTEQLQILKSSFYLQLYNLTEATVTRCLKTIEAAIETAELRPTEFPLGLQREWIRSVARTHEPNLGVDKRFDAARKLAELLMTGDPVQGFELHVSGGGNWDDGEIAKLFKRLGNKVELPQGIRKATKRPLRDELGSLQLVKQRRNALAHGSLSFVECSDAVMVQELSDMAETVRDYLHWAVESTVKFITAEILPEDIVEVR